jgi:hypothetical protein
VESCSPDGHSSIPAWIVSGTQDIKAIEQQPPFAAADKQSVVEGDTVLFTLQGGFTTNFFIASGGGWSWKPESGSGTSKLVSGCTRFTTTCRVEVNERGHIEVTNVVAEGMTFTALSATIDVEMPSVRIRSASGDFLTRPAAVGGSSTLALQVTVETSRGLLKNRVVNLTLDGIESTGGHQHGTTMPPGGLSNASPNTGSSGTANVTYSASIFAGNVQIRGTSGTATPAAEMITVRIVGLVELLEQGNVDLIGQTTWHPSNHWGTPAMVAGLMILSDSFYNQFSQVMQTNDIALEWGGKFDIGNTLANPPILPAYQTDGKHSEHRNGNSADVRTVDLTTAQTKYIQSVWEDLGGDVHPEGNPVHYHLRFQ